MDRTTSVILVWLACLSWLVATPVSAGPSLGDRLYDSLGIEVNGFGEARGGLRLWNDADEKDLSIGEARFQLELNRDFDWLLFKFKGDLLADGVLDELTVDLRDVSLVFSPADFMDVKLGRMVSTWGTGDLIFINDLFPKDWQAFFIGRNDEYLKKPSNVIRTSFFLDAVALDVVYTPLFEGSEFVSGERLSYYNPSAGRIVGRDLVMTDMAPNRYFRDGEIAGRLSAQVQGVELALYGYSGFWQEPEGMDPYSGRAIYPRLNVWGASVRSSLLGGVGNLEAGYYDSIQDRDGADPFIRPSEYRFLAGFERELAHELTGAVQYYLELIDEYDAYRSALPAGMHARDEYRSLFTLRLTQLLLNQDLTLSLFVYWSPSDEDGYARPKFSYKLSDDWLLEGGLNLFWGRKDYTFWGRFEDNSNAYVGLRYSF